MKMFFLQISLFSRSDVATWEMCLLNLPKLPAGYWGAFWGKIKQSVTGELFYFYVIISIWTSRNTISLEIGVFSCLPKVFSTGQIKLAAETRFDTGKKIFTSWTILANLDLNEYWVKDGWCFFIILQHSTIVRGKGLTLSYFWSWRSGIFHLCLVDTDKKQR